MAFYLPMLAKDDNMDRVISYRITTVFTTDANAPRFVIMESKSVGEDRAVGEYETEEDAIKELAELRDRAAFWRSG